MNINLLIVGVDPGTTLGYAVLDTEGRLIKIKSSKQMNLNSLISEIVKIGKVIAVGTDKAKVPSMVELFSVKIGGKIIRPKEDLKISEKKRLVLGYKAKDEHGADALASALFAYKEIKSLLKKIDVYVRNKEKLNIRGRLIELVVGKGISIRHAAEIIEKPKNEEVRIIKNVVEERKLSQADFLRLYNKVKMYEKDVLFLRKQNKNLSGQLKNVFDKYQHAVKMTYKLKPDEKREELVNFKERRIKFFDNAVKSKGKEIQELGERINKLNFILSNLNKNHLVKKLNNLGSVEFENKNRFLNIDEGDILLVDEPNIFNNKLIEKLKSKVEIIIHKKALNRATKKLPFVFINCKDLDLTETKYFAIASREELRKQIAKTNILSKVIEDYKKERVTDLYS